MINKHLSLSTYNNPLAGIPNSSTMGYGLIEADLLPTMAEYLNFTYDIVVPKDVKQLGFELTNGTWTGVLGQLVRQEADMSLSFGSSTPTTHAVLDESVPFIVDNVGIMIPYPEIEFETRLSMSTTSLIVISTIMSLVVIAAFSLWLVHKIKKDGRLTKMDLIFFLVSVTLSQGGFLNTRSTAFKLIHGAWLLALFLALNMYSGVLISVQVTPRYKFLVESVEDLASKQNVDAIVIQGSPSHGDIRESPVPALKKIAARIESNPKLAVQASGDFVDVMLEEPNQVFLLSDIVQAYEIGKDHKKMGRCRALTLGKYISSRNNCIFLRKNSSFRKDVDKMLLIFRQSGLAQHFENKFRNDAKRCSLQQLMKRNYYPRPIKLTHYRGAFFIILYGYLVCVFVLIIELVIFHCF